MRSSAQMSCASDCYGLHIDPTAFSKRRSWRLSSARRTRQGTICALMLAQRLHIADPHGPFNNRSIIRLGPLLDNSTGNECAGYPVGVDEDSFPSAVSRAAFPSVSRIRDTLIRVPNRASPDVRAGRRRSPPPISEMQERNFFKLLRALIIVVLTPVPYRLCPLSGRKRGALHAA